MKPMALMVTLMVACSALAATAWGQRQALSTDGFTSSRMQEAHADGYICWFLGLSFSGVVCIKVCLVVQGPSSSHMDLGLKKAFISKHT